LRSRQLRRGGPRRQSGSGAVSSGERPLTGVVVSGNSLSSCGRMLAGAGRGFRCCPPSNDSSSEVRILRSSQLRRGGPRRRSGSGAFSSGERPLTGVAVAGNSPSSCERMLAGAKRGFRGCPPANQVSSEVATVVRSRQLRRGGSRRRSGSGASSSGERPLTGVAVPGNSPSSCKRMLAGAELPVGGCPPTSDASPGVAILSPAPAPAKAALVGAARPRHTLSQFCDYLMPTAWNFGIL